MDGRYQIHAMHLPSGTVYRIYDGRTWYENDDRDFDPGAQTIPNRTYWKREIAQGVCAEMNKRYQAVMDDWIAEHEPEVGHYGE